MHLVLLPVPLAPALADRVAGWLECACARPGCDMTGEDLLAQCGAGQAQLIGIFDDKHLMSVAVTQVGRHGDGPLSCWVLAVGGRAAGSWSAAIAAVEAGALSLGCATVEFIGRRGWQRLLPDYAATPRIDGVHFVKALAP